MPQKKEYHVRLRRFPFPEGAFSCVDCEKVYYLGLDHRDLEGLKPGQIACVYCAEKFKLKPKRGT